MTSMCTVYHLPRSDEEYKKSPLTMSFTKEEYAKIWNSYLRGYLDSEDEEFLKKAEE